MDLGQHDSHCQVMSEGFVLWEIAGANGELPVLLHSDGNNMLVHVLMMEGEIRTDWGGRLFSMTRNCFANFTDCKSLEIKYISSDAKAYIMLFKASFITSLLKNTPPFPPSYLLKIKAVPVYNLSTDFARLFVKRIEDIMDIFHDNTHYFQTEMLKNALWMFMMDMANQHILQEQQNGEYADKGRKSILFKQFIRLLLANIQKEHFVGWYASQLCVTPQYLNRAVKSTSKKTAHEHICTVLLGAIMKQLENTDTPISKIASDYRFPDQATLTKFFKRHTGKTPTEYRKAKAML
ncbi:MAG: helix-turn-helix domain-containing protein [Prevotella sp.]